MIYIYTPYRLHIEDVVIYIYTPYRLHIEVVVIYIYTPYRLHIEAVVIYIYTPYRLHIEAVLIYIYTPYRLHIEAVVIYSSWYNCAFVGHSKKGSVTLLFVGVKRLGHEINGLPPSGEEVQNDRSFTSTCPPPLHMFSWRKLYYFSPFILFITDQFSVNCWLSFGTERTFTKVGIVHKDAFLCVCSS